MANLRIILVLALVVAWWQKDTLEDRALTQEGPLAAAAQSASRAWSSATPPSPAKVWISVRDQWLDDLFNPKQDYSHPAVEHAPAEKPVAAKPTMPAKTPASGAQSMRNDPPHADGKLPKDHKDGAPTPDTNDTKDAKVDTKSVANDGQPDGNSVDGKSDKSDKAATPGTTPADKAATPPTGTPADASIKRILIVGDSMSGDVGLSLRQLAFKYKQKAGVDVQIIDAHRHSTGLVVPSYYDWPRELPSLLTKNEPQVVVFMVGANDGQSMRLENQSWVLPGSTGWASEYERRVKQVVAAIPAAAKLVWLDLPPVRLKSLQEKTFMVNGSVKNALASCKHCVHLETRSTFGGDVYVENTPGSMLRSKDGVHYSRSGASFVAAQIWAKLGLPLYD